MNRTQTSSGLASTGGNALGELAGELTSPDFTAATELVALGCATSAGVASLDFSGEFSATEFEQPANITASERQAKPAKISSCNL